MSLSTEQKQLLKAAINAETDVAFVALRQANDEQGMADWYGEPSSFIVWSRAVTRDSVTGDGFDWTQVDNLTVGQGRIWDLIFDTQAKSLDASDAGKRAGIGECWKGTAAKLAVGAFVLGKCKRTASRAEKVFATGTGTTGTPGFLTREGGISAQDISDALRV